MKTLEGKGEKEVEGEVKKKKKKGHKLEQYYSDRVWGHVCQR